MACVLVSTALVALPSPAPSPSPSPLVSIASRRGAARGGMTVRRLLRQSPGIRCIFSPPSVSHEFLAQSRIERAPTTVGSQVVHSAVRLDVARTVNAESRRRRGKDRCREGTLPLVASSNTLLTAQNPSTYAAAAAAARDGRRLASAARSFGSLLRLSNLSDDDSSDPFDRSSPLASTERSRSRSPIPIPRGDRS